MDKNTRKILELREKDMEHARKVAEKVSQLKYVKEALEVVVMPKIRLDGYCGVDNIWSSLPKEIEIEGEATQGVKVKVSRKIDGIKSFQGAEDLLENVNFTGEYSQCLSILSLAFSVDETLYTYKRTEFLITLLENLELIEKGKYRHGTEDSLSCTPSIIFPQSWECKLITSLSQFIDIMHYNEDIWYRGQSSINYPIKPALFRDNYREHDMYQEILSLSWENFGNCKTRLDYLCVMQHYNIPTRLLDVTSNPLIALYFACSDEDNVGELIFYKIPHVYYLDDTRVAELSCLSALTFEEQEALKDKNNPAHASAKEHLNNLIRLEHPYYNDEPQFDDPIFVMPNRNNSRIQHQRGAFFLFGLSEKGLEKYRSPCIYWIGKEQKKKIKEDLIKVGIDEGFVYPEIEHIAKDIKKNCLTSHQKCDTIIHRGE